MAKINQIIATIPQSYEVVRSIIASILSTEIANQRVLINDYIANQPAGYDANAELFALECLPEKIYEERITLPNSEEMTPFVNIMFSGRKPADMNVPSGQHGVALFVIEAWTKSMSTMNYPNGEKSSFRLQKVLGIVSHILHSPEYKTLGVLGVVGWHNSTEIQIGQPEYGAESSEHQIQGSLIMQVKLNDKTPFETYTNIAQGIDTRLRVDNGSEIFWNTTF